jgi:peroxiredoxin-like protein
MGMSPSMSVGYPCRGSKGERLIDSHDYQVEVAGTGLKTGRLTASGDDLPPLDFASPPEFGGPSGVWSPEHLFVASVASCLMTTFRSMAERSGVEVVSYEDESVGRLARDDDGLFRIERITLRPRVVVSVDSRLDRARRLIEKAEKVCLIGRSIESETVLEPTVTSSEADQLTV